jgi:flagellar assembly protein FliH
MSSRIIRGDIGKRIAPVAWWDADATSAAMAEAPTNGVSLPEPIAHAALNGHAKQIEQQAFDKGFQEGRAVARQQHEAEMRPVAERLAATLEAFDDLRARIRRESEEELVELAIAIAKRILHRELDSDPEAVRALLRVAFERVGSREIKRVRVYPAHGNLIQSLLERACPDRNVELVADPALSPGDIVFETEQGDLDASVDSQLEEIRRGLAERQEV